METFKIEVREVLLRIVEVEAISSNESLEIVENLYKKEHIVLDASDHVKTEFNYLNDDLISEKSLLINDIIDYLIDVEQKHFEEFEEEQDNHIYKKLLRLRELNFD